MCVIEHPEAAFARCAKTVCLSSLCTFRLPELGISPSSFYTTILLQPGIALDLHRAIPVADCRITASTNVETMRISVEQEVAHRRAGTRGTLHSFFYRLFKKRLREYIYPEVPSLHLLHSLQPSPNLLAKPATLASFTTYPIRGKCTLNPFFNSTIVSL